MSVIFDSHTHLSDDKFKHDMRDVIDRADRCGVKKMIAVADNISSSSAVVLLSGEYPDIYPTAGIHPHYACSATEAQLNALRDFVRNHPEVVAVGECGLDFYYGKESKQEQVTLFRYQLELAQEFDLPVIVHCRNAEDTILPLLKEYKSVRGVFHCFSGDKIFCTHVIDLGYYVSFSGIVTFKNAGQVKEAVSIVPSDKLLVETDCPYIAPIGFRGKRNEPSFITVTVEHLADLRNTSFDSIAEVTAENTHKLFRIQDR